MAVVANPQTTNTLPTIPGSIMPSRVFWTIALLEVAIALLALILRHPQLIWCDCAANLFYGLLLVQGKLPFVDFIDTDPPLIIYLNAIPAFISRICDLDPILVFSLGVLLITVCASLLSGVLLGLYSTNCRIRGSGLLALVFLALSFAFFMFRFDLFGQREHLFVMLYIPFLLVRWIRWEQGKRVPHVGIALAILAGVGACLKPHFVLAAAAPELYWVLAKRNVRNLFKPEAIAFACTGLVYALHFPLLPSSVRNEFFGRWLPFILRRYDVYDSPIISLVKDADFVFACVMTVAPFLLFEKGQTSAALARPLAIFTGASLFFIYLGQHKGWSYHKIPAVYGSLFVWCIVCAEVRCWSHRWLPRRVGARLLLLVVGCSVGAGFATCRYGLSLSRLFSGSTAGTMAFGILCATVMEYLGAMTYRSAVGRELDLRRGVGMLMVLLGIGACFAATGLNPRMTLGMDSEAVDVVLKNTAEGDPILFITMSVDDPFPLQLVLHRRQGSRYLWLFPIPMFYAGVHGEGDGKFPYHRGEDAPAEERRFLQELAQDIDAFRPRLILIDDYRRTKPCPKGFVFSEYLRDVGFMDSAMRGYVTLPRTSRYLVFAPRQTK